MNEELKESIKQDIIQYSRTPKLPCSVAFELAKKFRVEPELIGNLADESGVKLCLCQLGLFGYYPEKKIVKPQEIQDSSLQSAIKDALITGKLSCRQAWDLASKFHLPKLTISGICEQMSVKIVECQLGAF